MFKIIPQKILMLRKYFWIFMKTEKVLEKILACMSVLKIQACSGKKSKSKKSKLVENKYKIRTDLPSARPRCFESNERDLSPALLTIVRLVLEKWLRTNSQPSATLSLIFFSWVLWS